MTSGEEASLRVEAAEFVVNFFAGAGSVRMKRKFTVVIEQDEEGYYVATVPALRGCHTQAKKLDTLMKRVREVIELCLEAEGNEGGPLELVGIQQISV
ncbi:MAG: type II toxin-antitoxin system HicB family antitoxin [Candidatus Acidiferrum sp.]